MSEKILKTLVFTSTLILCCLFAMIFSYRTAYNMAKSGKSPVLGEQERRDADRLRQFRNQLIQMTSEFVERSKRYPISEAAEFEKWLTNDFSPRFQEFRRKLMESDLPAQPLEALLKATDCLANAMMQPDRSDLRVSTTDEALEAAAVVDVFIDSLARGR